MQILPHKRKENPQSFLSTYISIGSKFPIPCLLASHRVKTAKKFICWILAFCKLSFVCYFPILNNGKNISCAERAALGGHQAEEPKNWTVKMKKTRNKYRWLNGQKAPFFCAFRQLPDGLYHWLRPNYFCKWVRSSHRLTEVKNWKDPKRSSSPV